MSTFDPSALMSILQNQGKGAPDTPPLQPPPTPNQPSPIADITQPAGPQIPQSGANNAAINQPQQDRLHGVKGYLANILHNFGEGVKAETGMETDAQKQARMFKQNLETQQLQNQQLNTASEIRYRTSQVADAAQRLKMDQQKADYNRFDVQKDPISGKVTVVDKQTLMDTLGKGGDPNSAFTSFSVRGDQGSMFDVKDHILKAAGINENTLPPSERGALTAATFQASQTGNPKPLQDWANNYANRQVKLAPTVANTTETKEVSDPNNPGSTMLVHIPKTTTSQKVLPGTQTIGQQSVTPKAPVNLSTSGGVKTLVGADGQPLQGKSATDTVYATDPKTGQQIYTTRTEAAAQGLQTPLKVSAPEVRKDQALSNRLADVQRKVGDYAATFDQPIDSQDQQAIAYLLQNPLPDNIAHMGSIPLAGYANNLLKQRGMQALSENGMKRLIQYNQARESLSGYQQILTNSSRSSDKVLELQLEQLPPPLADKDFANMTTGQFQQNIDLAGQHIPIFPGSAETQQSIKAKQQSSRQQTQDAQAKIQSNQQPSSGVKYFQGVPYTQGKDGQWHKTSK